MTVRRMIVFIAVYALLVGGEWFQFLRGFDTSHWTSSNWLLVMFILLAEAFAAAVIAVAVDRALPAVGGRAQVASRRSGRRGSQRYTAR